MARKWSKQWGLRWHLQKFQRLQVRELLFDVQTLIKPVNRRILSTPGCENNFLDTQSFQGIEALGFLGSRRCPTTCIRPSSTCPASATSRFALVRNCLWFRVFPGIVGKSFARRILMRSQGAGKSEVPDTELHGWTVVHVAYPGIPIVVRLGV